MPNFVKIPKQLFSISPANAKLYAVFLDFKAFNPEGFICPPFKRKVDRFYYHYWMKKLIKRKWATKLGACMNLLSYQAVWRLLGVDQSWNDEVKKYRFTYHKINIEDLPVDRKDYFKKLTDMVLTKVAGNKARQIKWRLNNKQTPGRVNKPETFMPMSCRKVASLFGLSPKSVASGSKYRERFFQVINEPSVRVKTPLGSRYPCKKIAL